MDDGTLSPVLLTCFSWQNGVESVLIKSAGDLKRVETGQAQNDTPTTQNDLTEQKQWIQPGEVPPAVSFSFIFRD
jgi:hypothetical protein